MNNREHRTISIAEQVFERLEKDILSGRYPKGEVLSEMKLSQELEVSRTPIREALIALVQEHLLEDTGRGMVVVGVSRQDMLDMYEIRLALEGKAAARAAGNMDAAALSEMGDVLDLQDFYIRKQEESGKDLSDTIKDLDSRFHEMIYTHCGSIALCDTLLPVFKKMTKYRKASVSRTGRAAQSLKEHRAVLKALKAGDGAEAERLIVRHLENARDSIASMGE